MIDYLFYRMYYWNTKVVKDFTPLLSAILCTSIFIGLNLLTLYRFIFYLVKNDLSYLSKNVDLIIGGLSFLLCYFYFSKGERYKKILLKNDLISIEQKTKNDLFCVFYVILTLVLIIWFTIKIRIATIGYL